MSASRIRLFIVLLGLLKGSILLGQQTEDPARFSGQILTKSGGPVPHARVMLSPGEYHAQADDSGRFDIRKIPAGTYELSIQSLLVEFSTRELDLSPGEQRQQTFRLPPSEMTMPAVEIVGRHEQTYNTDLTYVGSKSAMPIEKVPQSISQVTKELINDQLAYRLDETFAQLPGVNSFSYYNDYSMRGFRGSDNSQRLINGLKVGFSFWSQPMLPHMERVEVIKGPSSALFGQTSPGGTINMVTKKPLRVSRGSAALSIGSFRNLRGTADFTGPLNADTTIMYRLNLGYEDKESFRILQESESVVAAPSFTFLPAEGTRINVDFVFSNINSLLDRGQPVFNEDEGLTSTPVEFALSQPGDFMENSTFYGNVSLQQEITPWLSFNASYLQYVMEHKVEEHRTSNAFLPNDSSVMQMAFIKREQKRWGNNLTSYFNFDLNTGPLKHNLLVGFDFFNQEDNRTQWGARGDSLLLLENDTLPGGNVAPVDLDDPVFSLTRDPSTYNPNWFNQPWLSEPARTYSFGTYVQDMISFKKLSVLLALRHEWHRQEGQDIFGDKKTARQTTLIPRAGLVYELPGAVNVYATYAQGFNPQDASFIINEEIFGGPFDPEKSDLFEFGAKSFFFKRRLLATLAVYRIEKRDVLVNANDPGNPDALSQRGEEESEGVELSLSGSPMRGLRISANYAYNKTEIVNSDVEEEIGREKENAPNHSSGMWVKYSLQRGTFRGLGLGAGYKFVSERRTFDENLILPSYTRVDAALYYEIKQVRLSFKINNLTDETYWQGGYSFSRLFPGAPRNYLGEVRYNF